MDAPVLSAAFLSPSLSLQGARGEQREFRGCARARAYKLYLCVPRRTSRCGCARVRDKDLSPLGCSHSLQNKERLAAPLRARK